MNAENDMDFVTERGCGGRHKYMLGGKQFGCREEFGRRASRTFRRFYFGIAVWQMRKGAEGGWAAGMLISQSAEAA